MPVGSSTAWADRSLERAEGRTLLARCPLLRRVFAFQLALGLKPVLLGMPVLVAALDEQLVRSKAAICSRVGGASDRTTLSGSSLLTRSAASMSRPWRPAWPEDFSAFVPSRSLRRRRRTLPCSDAFVARVLSPALASARLDLYRLRFALAGRAVPRPSLSLARLLLRRHLVPPGRLRRASLRVRPYLQNQIQR